MFVYVLLSEYDYEGQSLIAVFSTMRKARADVNKRIKLAGGKWSDWFMKNDEDNRRSGSYALAIYRMPVDVTDL